jgi:hypothetical protein
MEDDEVDIYDGIHNDMLAFYAIGSIIFLVANIGISVTLGTFGKTGKYRLFLIVCGSVILVLFLFGRFITAIKIYCNQEKDERFYDFMQVDQVRRFDRDHRNIVQEIRERSLSAPNLENQQKVNKGSKLLGKKQFSKLDRFDRLFEAFGSDGGYQMRDKSQSSICVICFHNNSNTIYDPCGHGAFCADCSEAIAKKNKKCPLCRKNIDALVFYEWDDGIGAYGNTGFMNLS